MKKQQEEMEIKNLNRNLLILYYLWKKLSKYCNAQEKVSHPFFNFVPQQLIASKFRKRVQFLNLPTCFSSDSLCFIYFDIIIRQRLKKKLKLVELLFQSRERNQNMWFCATTDTGHAQISYLTVARHILQSRLIMLQLPIHGEYIGNYCHFCLIIAVCNFTVKPFLRRNNIGLDVKALFASHPLSSKSGDKTNHVIQQNNFEKRLFRCTRLFMD